MRSRVYGPAGMAPVEPKKSEVGSKMVRKNFLLQIWVLCNPKIGTSELLHANLFLLILNFGSSKSGKNRKSEPSLVWAHGAWPHFVPQ
jgi:hypothetical protein